MAGLLGLMMLVSSNEICLHEEYQYPYDSVRVVYERIYVSVRIIQTKPSPITFRIWGDFISSRFTGLPHSLSTTTLDSWSSYRLGCRSGHMFGSANSRVGFSPNYMGFFAS